MVYVIQCDPDVPPGTVADELETLSAAWSLVRLDRGESLPSVSVADTVIVLGGAMSVHDEEAFPFLRPLRSFMAEVVGRCVPCLGICLGSQLLAEVTGGRVVRKRWGELGNHGVELTAEGTRDRLFRRIGPRLTTFQWHNDSFDPPPDAVLLASSADCPHQAFRVGDAAWGLQFHPEVTPAIIAAWAMAEELDDGETRAIIAAWAADAEQNRQLITTLMHNFLSV